MVTFEFDAKELFLNSYIPRNSRPFVRFAGLRNVPVGEDDFPSRLPLFAQDGTHLDQEWLTPATLAALGVPTGILQTTSRLM